MIFSRRRHPVRLAIAAPLWLGGGMGARAQGPVAPRSCAVLELSKPVIDSMVGSVRSACGPVRLVLTRPVERLSPGRGVYSVTEAFRVRLAVENAGTRTLRAPASLWLDSAWMVHGGRVIAGHDPRYEYGLPFELSQSKRMPLRFGKDRDATRALGAGERSPTIELVVTTVGPAQGLRLWLGLRDGPPPALESVAEPGPPEPTGPLPSVVTRFLDAQRLPKERSREMLLQDVAHDLSTFRVQYGDPEDCPSGCVYPSAIGLRLGDRVGWLHLDELGQEAATKGTRERAMFRVSSGDRPLLGAELLPALSARRDFAGRIAYQEILPRVLATPYASRALLRWMVDRLYATDDVELSELLARSPAIVDDITLLSRLAVLPAQPYGVVKRAALVRLHALGGQLVDDRSTSAAVIVALADEMRRTGGDEPLARRLREHPNARRNIAAQLALADRNHYPIDWSRGLAMVRAPAAMKQALARHLRDYSGSLAFTGEAAQLLLDADRGGYTDVLIVLSQASMNQSVRAEATRRLPPGALYRDAR